MRSASQALVLVCAAACGRVGYDDLSESEPGDEMIDGRALDAPEAPSGDGAGPSGSVDATIIEGSGTCGSTTCGRGETCCCAGTSTCSGAGAECPAVECPN